MPQQPEGRRVYLAGPAYAEEYRRGAETMVRTLGWEPVDPMRRDYRGRTEGNETEIVEGDLAEIAACDATLAAFTARDEGTAMEAWYATDAMPLSRWAKVLMLIEAAASLVLALMVAARAINILK
jgi:nucleoside 2-deoxyribosyltransferase